MRSTRFRSRWRIEGALRCSDRALISPHVRVRNSTSARTSSGAALAAAVRTMNPPPALPLASFTRCRSRARSSAEAIFRETPVWSSVGM